MRKTRWRMCVPCVLWSFGAVAAPPALEIAQQGQGPVVLFLAGVNVHGEMWRPWADALAVDHRVLVVTPAGFAGVAPTDRPDGFMATHVAALARLLEAERAEGALVVGHSLGGVAALMLAAREPERVGRLLVVDSLPFLAELFQPGATPTQARQNAETMAKRSLALARDVYLAEAERAIAIAAKSASFLDRLRLWAAASDRATVVTAYQELLGMDYRAMLPKVRQPVLVLAAWDPAMPFSKESIEALFTRQYAELTAGEVRVVEDALHFLMIDQPNAFESALAAVLAR